MTYIQPLPGPSTQHKHRLPPVFEIPELLQPILALLSPQDLLQCITLCKALHAQCIPVLWSSISIMTKHQFHRFKSSATQRALARNGHHIRHFRTLFFGMLHPLLRPDVNCRNLTVLEFPRTCRFPDPEVPQGMSTLKKQLAPTTSPEDTTQDSSMEQDLVLEDIDMMISKNTHNRARKALGLFEGDEDVLMCILEKCPRLQTFTMVGFPFDRDQLIRRIANKLIPTSTTDTTALTSLRKLELTNLHFCPLKALSIQYLLDHCPPNLEELLLSISFGSRAEVDVGTQDGAGEGDANLTEEGHQGSIHDSMAMTVDGDSDGFIMTSRPMSLRKMAIRGDLSGPGNLIWLPLLRKCSQLSTIWVDIFTDTAMEQLASALSSSCPQINELALQCMTARPQEDAKVASVIQASAAWKSMSLSFFHGLGPLSTEALLKHSSTLESVVLEECDGFGSDDIQAVLSSCPNLRVFRAMTSNGLQFTSTVYLDAREMIDSPWVCHKLEELKLEITGFARPDQKIDQYSQPLTGPLHDGTIQGFDLQQIVYKQLGKLTRLKVLWLGHDKQDLDDEENYFPLPDGRFQFIDPEVQHACLEFSLRSGLGHLQGLKDLCVLNLDRMKTRVGLGEVQWMVAQWPKLEKIIGLVIQGEPTPKYVQWLYDNRPDIDLPPVLGNFTSGFI
ncbi:hypothetical protein EMPS_05316 [Entomortierella parvispora]|uniref:F-box domain-containing protein n=1 Tax=Entomortierella parvispora TaxID=205924 RepID=A0A9P3HAM5_9FUNG|nr:hypothetical protein EMPS_05316 [Entomortierella parvispora]